MGQYRYTYTSKMDPDGNILYVNNAPNVYVLSQLEISTIYQQVLVEIRSFGQSNLTETLLLNLINTKLDDCQLCLRLRVNLIRIAREISDSINSLRPMGIPNNINALPLTIVAKVRLFKGIISRRLVWHQ
jgi:hypothetical protein